MSNTGGAPPTSDPRTSALARLLGGASSLTTPAAAGLPRSATAPAAAPVAAAPPAPAAPDNAPLNHPYGNRVTYQPPGIYVIALHGEVHVFAPLIPGMRITINTDQVDPSRIIITYSRPAEARKFGDLLLKLLNDARGDEGLMEEKIEHIVQIPAVSAPTPVSRTSLARMATLPTLMARNSRCSFMAALARPSHGCMGHSPTPQRRAAPMLVGPGRGRPH